MPELKFDSIAHIYTVGDRQIPSVTQILNEFVKMDIGRGWYVSTFTGAVIDAEIFEAAGRMGTAIHDMIHAYLEDDLDEGGTSPDLLQVLAQFKEWEGYFKPEILHTERQLYSKKYGFAGTMDLVCLIGRDRTIVDFKSGAYGMASPQLAAYEKLDQEAEGSHSPRKKAVLSLPKSGEKFKWVPMKDPDAWTFFLSRLSTFNYIRINA